MLNLILLIPSILFISKAGLAEEMPNYQTTVWEPAVQFDPWKNPSQVGFTKDEIQDSDSALLSDVLKLHPSLQVYTQGGGGQVTSVSFSGARTQDLLVIDDGMILNDELSPSGSQDFSSLSSFGSARIQVVKGPSSALYGSGAMGGVLLTASDLKPDSNLSLFESGYLFELGSWNHSHLGLEVTQHSPNAALNASVENWKLNGPSAAGPFPTESSSAAALELDGSNRWLGRIKGAFQPHSNHRLFLNFRIVDLKADQDNSGGAIGDDTNNESRTRTQAGQLSWQSAWREQWSTQVQISHLQGQRKDTNPLDPKNGDDSNGEFDSTKQHLRLEGSRSWNSKAKATLGLEHQLNRASSRSSLNSLVTDFGNKTQGSTGIFGVGTWEDEHRQLELGARTEGADSGESVSIGSFLWRQKLISQISYSLQVSEGFKRPTLYQRYSVYGEPGLRMERTTGFIGDLDLTLEADSFGVGLNHSHSRNLIDYDLAQNKFANIQSAETQGGFIRWLHRFGYRLSSDVSLNQTRAVDLETGLHRLRVPRQSASFALLFESGMVRLRLEARHKGAREDLDPNSFSRVQLPSTTIYSFAFAHRIRGGHELRLRLENLSNANYQDVAGYSTRGRSVYLGLQGDLNSLVAFP